MKSIILVISLLCFYSANGVERGLRIKTKNNVEVASFTASHALLIASSNYTNGWPKLDSVIDEMKEVRRALEAKGFHITLVTDPTGDELSKAFKTFIDNYGYDIDNRLVFFYSGHGHSRGKKKGYLVPVDAPNPGLDEKGFLAKALNMNQIMMWSRNIESRHALFLFDSCFSGSIFMTKALPPMAPAISKQLAKPVRQFITAGSAGETVPANSIFTPTFIQALDGDADYDKDSYITGTELGMFLTTNVQKYNTNQTPQYGKIADRELSQGDFIFKSKAETVTHIKEAVPIVIEEEALTSSIELTNFIDGVLYLDGREHSRLKANRKYTLKDIVLGAHTLSIKHSQGIWEKECNVEYGNELTVDARIVITVPSTPLIQPLETPKIPSSPESASLAILETENDFRIGNMLLKMVSSGKFKMGSPYSERGRNEDEYLHTVVISRKFWIGQYELTQAEWDKVMKVNPSVNKGSQRPVDSITWDEAVKYCEIMTENLKSKQRLPEGYEVRLPTEAEWEYTCRAGTESTYGGVVNDLSWYEGNSGGRVHNTGNKSPNKWGLYDMHGNVFEWCYDYYGSYERKESIIDPIGPSRGRTRVYRGGSFNREADALRSAYRRAEKPDRRYIGRGFRIVLAPKIAKKSSFWGF